MILIIHLVQTTPYFAVHINNVLGGCHTLISGLRDDGRAKTAGTESQAGLSH